MIKIPSERKWAQTNSSDVFGSLYSTYNVNFDREGYLQISPKAVSIYSTDDNEDFGLPLSAFVLGSKYFILTADSPFFLSTDLTFTKIADSSSDIGANSDAIAWQGNAYVTTADNLDLMDDEGTWDKGKCALDATTSPHPLEVMGNFSGGHLVIGNGNEVLRLNGSYSVLTTLEINEDYEITCLKYFQNNLYIGTRCLSGREAKVFVWNGSGTSAQSEYAVGASWVFALAEYQSSIVCMTSEGQLLRFNGGGFSSLANLPVYYSKYRWINPADDTSRVHRRGMKVDGDIIYINLDGSISLTDSFDYLPEQPSGVWCYDPKVGLYCRHLSSTDKLTSISVSSRSGNTLTLASATKAVTGEPILVSNAGSLTGVSVRNTYYVIKVSDTEIKLANTPADAKAGTEITLGGTAGVAVLKANGYLNYGYRTLGDGDVGALALADRGISTGSGSIFPEIIATTILWGFGTDSKSYLNCLSSASNVGGFITNKVWSSDVTDNFQNLYVKYEGLDLDHEEILVKKRSRDVFGLPSQAVDGTYSTKHIIGTDSPLLGQASEGYNVNILSGSGAGKSASIEEINGLEYHLSEDIDSASSADDVTFSVDSFEGYPTAITSEDIGGVKGFSLGSKASWNQFMLELRGQAVRIEELQLVNKVNKST